MLTNARARMRDHHWLYFFAAILVAWVLLALMQASNPPGVLAQLAAICSLTATQAGFFATVTMWVLMCAAMMAPTMIPALGVLDDLTGGRAGAFTQFLGGYAAIWIGFSVLAASLQLALAGSGILAAGGVSLSPLLTGGLLVLAGGYQFSALKAGCLSKCQSPMAFFMTHWRESRWNAAAMGLRLGAICLGCCWALMLLAFVGGTMNLIWMGLATVIMVFEKLPQMSHLIVRPLGIALIAAGLGVLSTALV